MRRQLFHAVLATVAVVAPASASRGIEARRVRMRDVRLDRAIDVAAAMTASGSGVIELPFDVAWDGRFRQLELGPGWARLLPAGAIAGPIGARPLDAHGGERRLPGFGPRFVVLRGAALAPDTRVLVMRDELSVAVRWWNLRLPTGEAAGVELVLDRLGGARFQYLHVPSLPPSASGIDDAPLGLGESLRSGLAIEIPSPEPRAPFATGPPPVGCASPGGTWCDAADGPTADAVILLDARFEEPVATFTATGEWHVVSYGTCAPGATTPTGSAWSVADDATCARAPGAASTLLGPVVTAGPATYLSFSARADLEPGDTAEILANGTPIATLPGGLDPATWYRFGPLALPSGSVQVGFRFTAGAAAPTRIGWMVDDVFVHDDNGANWPCVVEARYHDGVPPLSDCADTEHDGWTFDEGDFCLGCTYTFYAVVECGTEMHLPFSDMEGAEVRVTEVVSGTSPRLTCSNDAFRNPGSPPVLRRQDCCATPGQEIWTAPAFTATDNRGAGDVAWGMPGCASVFDAYDLDFDGIECSELAPTCGGTLDRVSPGEEQVMDCVVPGAPGLCGIYRIDVVSGGFAWDLFANCTGGAERGFRLFADCEHAWAAWTPLPELALSSATAACPSGDLEVTMENLGCADVTADFTIRATSSCPMPDTASWTISGGVPAGGRRTERLPFTASCAPATLTLEIDPADAIAECSEAPGAAACAVIPGADALDVAVADPVPSTDPLIFASKQAGGVLRFDWSPVPLAATYRAARGLVGPFYDHVIDEAALVGACSTGGATRFDDTVSLTVVPDYYFLVAPVGPCGREGGWGTASDGTRRPPPALAAPCP